MKLSLPVILTLCLLAASPLPRVTAQTIEHTNHESAQDSQSIDDADDEPVQRVARLSFAEGDVSFLRAGISEWADAVQNLPLLSGDQLYVGKSGRAEIQLGNGNYVRLSENTAITIADLTHTIAQLELTEGTAIIRLERFGAAFTRFEVDTPNAALVFDQDGLYRVNVASAEESEIIIRRGSAEVATLDGSFKVREGHRLLIDSSANGRLEVAVDNSRDDWDRWSYDRDRTIDRDVVAASPDYVNNHETTFNCFYGASELAGYGSWTHIATYGYCWIPRVATGWAPYRAGQWLWVPRVGWSWLANEPWGWAPYHYGRWAHLPGIGWAWVPGINSNRHTFRHSYYQWRPALVSFFNCPTSRGHFVGWYPLAPGERWRRPERSGRDRNDHGHLRPPTARNAGRRPEPEGGETRLAKGRNGVSVLPVAGFARPGQTPASPGSPDVEVTRWVSKGVRTGLPELGPTEAFAPRRHRADRSSRPVVKPPSEVAGRPVVTRNRPSTAQAETSAPRERRLVTPRRIRDLGDSGAPFLGEGDKREGRRTNAGRSDGEANGGDSGAQTRRRQREVERENPDAEATPRIRPRRADSADTGADDATKQRLKLEEEKPDQPKDKENSGDSNEERQRSRPRFRPVPPADHPGSAGPKTDENQPRHKPKAERPRSADDGSQPRSDEYRKRPDSDDSGKSRPERTAPPAEPRERPRAEPKQPQQEHRQEKQERREERREERERRKGNQ